jgi:hypothetical protein
MIRHGLAQRPGVTALSRGPARSGTPLAGGRV